MQELVDFLPRLYAPGFVAIERCGGGTRNEADTYTMPWPNYNQTVKSFIEAASREWWQDFRYTPETAGPQLRDPDFVRTASLEQLRPLITYCVRGERFCDGFWAGMIKAGHIRNILERLKALMDTGVQPGD